VLFPGFTPTMWFGLLPLLFVVAGVAGIIGNPPRQGNPPATSSVRSESSPVVLKARYSPATKFFGSVCISVLWNGLVSVFLWLVIQMWMGREHGPKWFLTIFLIPFVMVGLVIIGMTVHAFFGLFSPRAQLRTDSSRIPLGDSVEIQWQFSGRVEKIREFRLVLEGREETDERTGDGRRNNTNVFYTADIVHLTDWKAIGSGSALCTIPADRKPSDSDGDHRVLWMVRLKAEVHRGADLDDEYPRTASPLWAKPDEARFYLGRDFWASPRALLAPSTALLAVSLIALPTCSRVSLTALFCASVNFALAVRRWRDAVAAGQSCCLTAAIALSASLFAEGSEEVLKLASSFAVSTCCFFAQPAPRNSANTTTVIREMSVFIVLVLAVLLL